MARFRLVSLLLTVLMLAATACASDSDSDTAGSAEGTGEIRIVSPEDGAELQADSDVVVLDLRTPEEFADGHLDGALMIDFYESDFADRIAELDPDALVSHLLQVGQPERPDQGDHGDAWIRRRRRHRRWHRRVD